jgi:hypothetical protein
LVNVGGQNHKMPQAKQQSTASFHHAGSFRLGNGTPNNAAR